MRTRPPALRTLPSRTVETPSRSAIARMSSRRSLKRNDEVRAATRRPGTCASALISSSVIPSLKYSFPASELTLRNGSTATETGTRAASPETLPRSGAAERSENARSLADWKRSGGFLRRQRRRTLSRLAGTAIPSSARSRGSSRRTATRLSEAVAAAKARRPVSIS